MARFLDTTPDTDLERLRKALDECERLATNVKGSGAGVAKLLEEMDEVDALTSRLRQEGADIRSELTRLESIQMRLQDRASDVVREAAAAGGMASLRASVRPPRDRWWWYLDDLVRRRRKRTIVRAILGVLLAFALIFGGYHLLMVVFPPNPVASKVVSLEADASRALEDGNFQAALDDYREASQVDPSDGSLRIWVAVLADRVGDAEESKEATAAARKLLPGANFYIRRGYVYLDLGSLDKAAADLERAIELDPSSAMAYYLHGNVMAAQRHVQKAIADYDKAAELAKAQGDARMEGLARIQKAYVLQSGSGAPEPIR